MASYDNPIHTIFLEHSEILFLILIFINAVADEKLISFLRKLFFYIECEFTKEGIRSSRYDKTD